MKLSELSLTDLFALKSHFEESGRIEHIIGLDDKMIEIWEPDSNKYYPVVEEIEKRINEIEQ